MSQDNNIHHDIPLGLTQTVTSWGANRRVSRAKPRRVFHLDGDDGRMFRAKGLLYLVWAGGPLMTESRVQTLMRFLWAGLSVRRLWDAGEISPALVFLFFSTPSDFSSSSEALKKAKASRERSGSRPVPLFPPPPPAAAYVIIKHGSICHTSPRF